MAVGLLTVEQHSYSARPILISPTCKRELSSAHAELIDTVV